MNAAKFLLQAVVFFLQPFIKLMRVKLLWTFLETEWTTNKWVSEFYYWPGLQYACTPHILNSYPRWSSRYPHLHRSANRIQAHTTTHTTMYIPEAITRCSVFTRSGILSKWNTCSRSSEPKRKCCQNCSNKVVVKREIPSKLHSLLVSSKVSAPPAKPGQGNPDHPP